MNIAICDDEPVITEELERYLKDCLQPEGFGADIKVFFDAESLLAARDRIDLALLDCCLPGIDGIELARRLRARFPGCEVVFISSYSDYVFDSYDVEHLRFIMKPFDREKIAKVLDSWLSRLNERRPVLVATDLSVPMDEIIRADANRNGVSVTTEKTVYTSRKTVAQLETELSPRLFARVRRGCLINLDHVVRHTDSEITLDNGDVISVSRRNRAAFLKSYTQRLSERR
ncbi:MAG: LytTR family DNA-binding domain-containing protein [Clostridia bacterium]|nr:LytTR family DNA-binding domain-containing protein [Clostridia bacterium]